jgi:hypothetical protein
VAIPCASESRFLWRETPPGGVRLLTIRAHCSDEEIRGTASERRRNVRIWHLADIDADDEHVCFWG